MRAITKFFIRVRVEVIDASGGPEDPAISESNTYFFYPTAWIIPNMLHLYRHVKMLLKGKRPDQDPA